MKALRTLLFMLLMTITTIVIATLAMFSIVLPPLKRYRAIIQWSGIGLWLGRVICGMNYRVIGAENLPKTPCIVLAKHSSTWETLFMSYMLPPQSYVAKRELLWIPFFGWGFALVSPIAIDRGRGSEAFEQIISQGRKRMSQGFWISIYPEGTRIPVGQRVKYKTGGARLAIALNAPILPLAHNAGYLWPKKPWVKSPGTITVSLGKPIYPDGREATELIREVEDWIEAETQRLGDPREEWQPALQQASFED